MKIGSTVAGLTVSIVLAAACAACGDGASSPQNGIQALNYAESTAVIANPDQGFYSPVYVKIDESGVAYNKNIVNDATQLYHLRCDISAFSSAVNGLSDKPLTQAALDGVDSMLAYLKENDKNAVLRFAYDPSFNGAANKEPALDVILHHIEQVCAVIDGYENTVTAIEAGLIGPWGEMHTSAIANAAHITPVIDAFLTNTTAVPISVRTPKMIYDYLGVSPDDAAELTISPDDKAYRLGLYNDGYLGSDSDLGTYTNRQRDVAFVGRQASHLPFGGEVTVPESTLHNIETCLPEMYSVHLSYLNIAWDNRVIDKWKSTYYTAACGSDKHYYGETAFTYIQNRMGYRYVLKKSVFTCSATSDELTVELTLQNVGFGNLNKKKRAELIFTDENGTVAYTQSAGEFTGAPELRYAVTPDVESGTYEVYLRLYGEEQQGTPLYCVQFANDGLWNATLKANKIGTFTRTAQ